MNGKSGNDESVNGETMNGKSGNESQLMERQ